MNVYIKEAWSDPTVIHLNYTQSDTAQPYGQPDGHTATLPGSHHGGGDRKPLPMVETGEHLDAEILAVAGSKQRNDNKSHNSAKQIGDHYFYKKI